MNNFNEKYPISKKKIKFIDCSAINTSKWRSLPVFVSFYQPSLSNLQFSGVSCIGWNHWRFGLEKLYLNRICFERLLISGRLMNVLELDFMIFRWCFTLLRPFIKFEGLVCEESSKTTHFMLRNLRFAYWWVLIVCQWYFGGSRFDLTVQPELHFGLNSF